MSFPNEWIKFAPKPRDLMGEDKWNVFLSYRSVNRTWVLTLYDVLREQGQKVFLDQCVLRAGDELTTRLEEALSFSQTGLLVWSNAARDSDWVRREYQVMERQATKKKRFQFIPLKLDNSELPAFADNRIFLDFSNYPDGPNGGELLRLLHAIQGSSLSPEAAFFANAQDEAAQKATAIIGAAIRNSAPNRLIELFNENGLPWRTSASLGNKVAEGLTKLGCYEEAIYVLVTLEQRFPKAIRPQQIHALALARRGKENDLDKAQEILGVLYEGGERDPETLGIYARTWMDRYEKSGDLSHLYQSRDLYVEAFQGARDDYYTGINAAAKSVFLGFPEDLERAAEYAQQVQEIVGTEPHARDYWMTATVAEIFLIQKKYQEAGRIYKAAVAMARSEVGSHQSTWKQACRLMEKLRPIEQERLFVREAFPHLPG